MLLGWSQWWLLSWWMYSSSPTCRAARFIQIKPKLWLSNHKDCNLNNCMRCVCFRVKHGTVFCYTRADHDLGPYVSERLSHHSHHSHQHPRSEDHNHLSFDTLHLSSVIKTPVISTLLPISHCPVYRSHPRTKPDLSILTCVFPYPRHFGFSAAPVLQHSPDSCKRSRLQSLLAKLLDLVTRCFTPTSWLFLCSLQ